MPDLERRRWYAVPKHRIIDAAPVAGIAILFSIPNFYPIAFALLHVWLWLRHPRGRARYVIAAIVAGAYLLITIGPMLVITYIEHLNNDGMSPINWRLNWSSFFKVIGAAAAGGIVPILYRLLSRQSLTYAHDTQSNEDSRSRGSIADILFLSIFSAVTFVVLQNDDSGRFHWRSPAFAIATGISASLVALLAMRMLARVRGMAAVTSFVAVLVLGTVITVTVFELSDFIFWYLGDSRFDYRPFWERGDYDGDIGGAILYVLPIPIFAIVMRGCGVILSRDGKADPNAAIELTPTLIRSWGFRLARWTGGLIVAALVALICFAAGGEGRHGAGGWPLTYMSRIKVGTTWDPIVFSTLGLVVDLVSWLLIFLAIATPGFIASRLSKRRLRISRVVILSCFAALMLNTCVIAPLRSNALKTNSVLSNVASAKDIRSLVPALWDELEETFDWLPDIDRNYIYKFTATGADSDLTRRLLAMPRLQSVTLVDCELTQAALDPLRESRFLTHLGLQNCRVEGNIFSIIKTLPRLQSLTIDSSLLSADVGEPWSTTAEPRWYVRVDRDGLISVPAAVTEMTLEVPNDEDRAIEISGAPGLQSLFLRNTTGDVPSTVTTLKLQDLPLLQQLELDNCQTVDVSITDAPRLFSITDQTEVSIPNAADLVTGPEEDEYLENIARFAGLTITGDSPFTLRLKADVSQCDVDRFDIHGDKPDNFASLILLNGRKYKTWDDDGRLPEQTAVQLVRGLPREISALEIHGINIGHDFISALNDTCRVAELRLRDCKVSADAFDVTADQLAKLTALEAQAYTPNDQQFAHLAEQFQNLREIDINGSKLTAIPPAFAPPDGIIRLGDADRLTDISANTIQNAALLMTLGRDEYQQSQIRYWLEASPQILLHGVAANGKNLAQVRARIESKQEALNLCFISPVATKDDFANINWQQTKLLSVVDARIDDATVASWKFAGALTQLDLSGCDVTTDVLTGLSTYNLSFLWLRDLPTSKPLPVLSGFGSLLRLDLSRRTISEADVDRLLQSDIGTVDLSGCDASTKAKEKIRQQNKRWSALPDIIYKP